MNSDRDGKITKKSGLQKEREENVQADERFVLEKRYKIRFVFPNSIAVLSFIYIYVCVYDDLPNEIGLDSLLQYLPLFSHDHFSVHSFDDQ